jgi:hypothetical protein
MKMEKIIGNEPAMPTEVSMEGGKFTGHHQNGHSTELFHGLTIRQHFAALAIQGILSNPQFANNAKDMAIKKGIKITDDAMEFIEPFAKLAVDCADALIAELNKPISQP